MEGRYSDLELLFIQEVLDQHGEYMNDLLSEAVDQKNLIKEGILFGDIKYRVTKYGLNPVLQVYFPDYGRFIEINYHRKSLNTKSWTSTGKEVKEAIWGRKNKKLRSRKKKDTRWYAKTAYGSINRLIAILMNEFTKEEKNRLKQIMENPYSKKS